MDLPRISWLVAAALATGMVGAENALAGEAASLPKPVPRVQAIPLPYDQVSFQRDGTEIARYHYDPTLHRPFVYPIIGPAGRSLTRMGHPQDPETHRRHNSVWLSHFDLNGVDFWGDPGKGRIVHKRTERLDDGLDAAAVQTMNEWIDGTGQPLLREPTVAWPGRFSVDPA
jgi:hypothetical protein